MGIKDELKTDKMRGLKCKTELKAQRKFIARNQADTFQP